jgi:hypothetical protein
LPPFLAGAGEEPAYLLGRLIPHPALKLGQRQVVTSGYAIPVHGSVDGGGGEAEMADEPARESKNVWCALVLAPTVSDQNERAGAGVVLRRPEDARNYTVFDVQIETALADASRNFGLPYPLHGYPSAVGVVTILHLDA